MEYQFLFLRGYLLWINLLSTGLWFIFGGVRCSIKAVKELSDTFERYCSTNCSDIDFLSKYLILPEIADSRWINSDGTWVKAAFPGIFKIPTKYSFVTVNIEELDGRLIAKVFPYKFWSASGDSWDDLKKNIATSHEAWRRTPLPEDDEMDEVEEDDPI